MTIFRSAGIWEKVNLRLPKRRIRSIIRSVIRFLFKLLSKIECKGLENIPVEGGVILAVNHLSQLDSPLVFMFLTRDNISALIADSYQSNPFLRWIIHYVDGIWINREQADYRALRAATLHLEKGGLLGVAPEGTRSKQRALITAKTGVAYLADKAQVPVVPVAITGTEKAFFKLSHFQRPKLTVQFGTPIFFDPIKGRGRSSVMKRNTDEIMCWIAVMLPEAYRGVYKNHPKLEELLKSD
jgi:1-acyl-sn-glycerol-3-phosphate acyltransferase